MSEYEGKNVLITGAGGEIGYNVFQKFHEVGSNIIITDINYDKVLKIQRDNKNIKEIMIKKCDVSDPDDVIQLYNFIKERYEGLDIIVNSAGLYEHIELTDITPQIWRKTISVNLDGVFYVVSSLLPLLRNNSSIVNISSHAGHQGSVDHTPYATAKGGVLALTRSLSKELAPKTRVNAISPGLIDTKMLDGMESNRKKDTIRSTPLKRLGTPNEIADAIFFLCSEKASFITGETLHANGGMYISS